MDVKFYKGNAFHSILLIAFFTSFTKAYILRLPCLTYANFSIVKPNHALTGYSLEIYTNLNEDECKNKCIEHRSCKSINTRNTIGENCQLNSKSNEDPFDNVTLSENVGWTYRTTDQKARNIGYVCENIAPCPFEQTCTDSCTCPGYECQVAKIEVSYHCQDAYSKGYRGSTVLSIYFIGVFMEVRCDMVTDGGGWIIFQRRIDATVDFYRGWKDYKNGFGDLNGNFWLGLEKIHKLTSPGRRAILRVDLKHFRAPNMLKYAEYSNFEILSESDGYMFTYTGYSGNADNSLADQYGKKFSTFDHDQDNYIKSCAVLYQGAWWYNACHSSNLNGLYPKQNQEDPKYMSWKSLYNKHGGIIFSEMKIRYSNP